MIVRDRPEWSVNLNSRCLLWLLCVVTIFKRSIRTKNCSTDEYDKNNNMKFITICIYILCTFYLQSKSKKKFIIQKLGRKNFYSGR